MAFAYKDSLLGNSRPSLVKVVIYTSMDIEPGDAVTTAAYGYVEKAAAAEAIFGIVHAIVDKYGRSLLPERDTQADIGSASISSGVITVASGNTTTDKICALVDVSPFSRYSADVTGTIGATASSNLVGAMFELTNENSIAEAGASRSTLQQIYGWGTDPNDSGNIIVTIKESEIFSSDEGIAQAT